MDLLKDNLKPLYFKYLSAAFGSTLIMSIYSLVDTIVIGQYEGPNGAAAVATFSPMWNILFAIGLLFGIGGAVIMAQKRGQGDIKTGNYYFTLAFVLALVVSAVIFSVYNLGAEYILYFCGARDKVLELALKYAHYISLTAPFFIMGQVLVPFIRNDNAPFKTTLAVMAGGIFNIFGDIFFVFGCDMGIIGAGLATAIGELITAAILASHFFSKKCRLKFVPLRTGNHAKSTKNILAIGSSNFIIDVAMGILTIMFNNQILSLFDSSALSVYSVINNLSTVLQTLSYAVGESSQSIISVNFGAKKYDRVKTIFRYASLTALILGIGFFLLGSLFPNTLIHLFMDATPRVLEAAPEIMRKYMLAYILLGFNVNATYYFQSVGKPSVSMHISILRGIALGAILIYTLPILFDKNAIWFTAPLTELIVFIYAFWNVRKTKLSESPSRS